MNDLQLDMEYVIPMNNFMVSMKAFSKDLPIFEQCIT